MRTIILQKKSRNMVPTYFLILLRLQLFEPSLFSISAIDNFDFIDCLWFGITVTEPIIPAGIIFNVLLSQGWSATDPAASVKF